MITKKSIVFLGVFALAACHTTSQAPLDDAYYWPDKTATHAHSHSDSTTSEASPSTTSSPSSPSSTPSTPSPAIEYTNVQDTTVTIKINR